MFWMWNTVEDGIHLKHTPQKKEKKKQGFLKKYYKEDQWAVYAQWKCITSSSLNDKSNLNHSGNFVSHKLQKLPIKLKEVGPAQWMIRTVYKFQKMKWWVY